MSTIKDQIEKNRGRYLAELFELLRIPSVSADPAFKEDVFQTAEYVAQKLKAAGLDEVKIFPTDGYPVVYGEKIIDRNAPTVLVYGHYDVQPADPYELWTSPPFEPVIKDEKIYARGASDDKGQMFMHVKAVETLLSRNELPCNVKLMIEGEEEVGSVNLAAFIKTHKDLLKADVVMVSDTSMIANEVPSITVGLRGLTYMEVEVTGANRDLHSGVYGGAVANPINVLCEMIAMMKDENGHITIPGFYDEVVEISKADRDEMAKAPFNLNNYKNDLAIDEVTGEKDFSTSERTSIRPALDVNGIWGGYTGKGAKTVLPSKAFAKISMRLVPDQNSLKIAELFEKYFNSIAPKSVKVKVHHHHGGEPVVTPTDSVAYKAASRAMEIAFGKKPIPQRTGGSIPVVALFEKELGLKTILMGFGLDSDAIHSPNEHFGLFNYFKGIETICEFYKQYAEMNSK